MKVTVRDLQLQTSDHNAVLGLKPGNDEFSAVYIGPGGPEITVHSSLSDLVLLWRDLGEALEKLGIEPATGAGLADNT